VSSRGPFVLVGHCRSDNYMMKTAIERAVRGVPVVFVYDSSALAEHICQGAVLLVNRVLEGEFHTDSGLELIQEIVKRRNGPVTLLISDFPEAQNEAVELGARRGFGKRQLYEAATVATLREAIEDKASES
jgi:hypothetical protein